MQGKLSEALEGLLGLEKQQRLAEDITGTKMACTAILTILREAGDWKGLNEHILLLAKRRSQLKQAVQAFVRQAMSYVDQTPEQETKVELIRTLQSVTEGKIFVEIERARLTRKLARLKEAEGNITEAADVLQEVAVETYGAMAKTEKIAFILEQVRLCLDRGDYVRAMILAKKVSPRAFKVVPNKKGEAAGEIGIEGTTIEAPEEGTPTLEELKLQYYHLLIRYHINANNYIDACRCYRAVYESDSIKDDKEKWVPVLQKICWYVVLAAASSDQVTLLQMTAADKKLDQLPAYKELLQTFITKEVVYWDALKKAQQGELSSQTEVFGGEQGQHRLKDFKLRVVEHNILVISQYYSRITMQRLSQLLCLNAEETEKHLSEMVVGGQLYAKIDRPAGTVRFAKHPEPEQLLNSWSNNITKLLNVVNRSCQQIQKESMVHKVPIGTTA
eukprot:jgi/Astpho2/6770/e_gw1.00103.16.1_t